MLKVLRKNCKNFTFNHLVVITADWLQTGYGSDELRLLRLLVNVLRLLLSLKWRNLYMWRWLVLWLLVVDVCSERLDHAATRVEGSRESCLVPVRNLLLLVKVLLRQLMRHY